MKEKRTILKSEIVDSDKTSHLLKDGSIVNRTEIYIGYASGKSRKPNMSRCGYHLNGQPCAPIPPHPVYF